MKVIEVDDIKIRKYGTTACCDPAADFPEAGEAANEAILSSHPIILVEAFCEKQHLEWVLAPTSRRLTSREVSVVWLHCDVETSIARKAHALSHDVIRSQHRRYESRFRVPGEHVIDTVSLTVDQVAQRILKTTSFGKRVGP